MWNPFRRPFVDVLRGLEALQGGADRRAWSTSMALLLAALLASWWVYVPLHEFFHAWGCLAVGGSVTRLEIDHVYGAAWLARIFPYVVPGSQYAGRLSGFDTHGSDVIYLVTVFFPYLLTLFVGVPVLRLATRRASPMLLGASLPWALAPLLSLPGDYYEMGSIVISRLARPWVADATTRWRADDLPLLLTSLFGGGAGNATDALGIVASFVLGAIGAFVTYALGAAIAKRLGRSPG